MAREGSSRAGWIGVPSVPLERAAEAFAAFYLAVSVAIAIDVLLIIYNHQPETWQSTLEMVFDDGGQILAWALVATWPIMEVMRMVLAGIWRDRIRREAREEGREEGIEQGIEIGEERSNQRWREWVQRRDQAASRGEPFDEPMPDDTEDGAQA